MHFAKVVIREWEMESWSRQKILPGLGTHRKAKNVIPKEHEDHDEITKK